VLEAAAGTCWLCDGRDTGGRGNRRTLRFGNAALLRTRTAFSFC